MNKKEIEETKSLKNENSTNVSNKTENSENTYKHFFQNKTLNILNSTSEEDSCDFSTWRDWISEMVIRRARQIIGNIKQDHHANLTC